MVTVQTAASQLCQRSFKFASCCKNLRGADPDFSLKKTGGRSDPMPVSGLR